MKISARYQTALEKYLEWESARTPASGSFQEGCFSPPLIGVQEGGTSAAEALCLWESTGVGSSVRPEEEELLNRYIRGKMQRDWWTKEIGWWNKNAAYIPEEFLPFLHPLNFIDLFGRGPIPRIIRYYHDNSYAAWEFYLDEFMLRKVREWNMDYYERDDRDSALKNFWRVMSVKWIDPFTWRVRRKYGDFSR